jgi:hypothetical protein
VRFLFYCQNSAWLIVFFSLNEKGVCPFQNVLVSCFRAGGFGEYAAILSPKCGTRFHIITFITALFRRW